jgi:hypothetical protein
MRPVFRRPGVPGAGSRNAARARRQAGKLHARRRISSAAPDASWRTTCCAHRAALLPPSGSRVRSREAELAGDTSEPDWLVR